MKARQILEDLFWDPLQKRLEIPIPLLFEMELAQRSGHEGFAGRVFCYFNINLSRKLGMPLFSIKDVASGRVLGHEKSFALRDVTFKVSEAGRQRVISSGSKNVHAGVVGTLVAPPSAPLSTPVTYNPRKYSSFVSMPDETPIRNAKMVYFVGGKLSADGVS